MQERLLRCPDCGTRLEEWDTEQGGSPHAYIAQEFMCPGCTQAGALMENASKMAKARGPGAQSGTKVRLVPKYIIDAQIRSRTPEDRERLQRRAKEALEDERGRAETPQPIRSGSLGGKGRPPPV